VATLMYGQRSRGEALADLAELGVERVDLWSFSRFAQHFDPAGESAEDVRAELDEHGMEAPIVSLFNEEPVLERLRLAAAFGARTAIMAGRSPRRPGTWRPQELAAWLEAAEGLGMTLAFENHVDTLETIDEMEALLDVLDHPAARICLAPPHLWIAGERAEDAVVRLSDRIAVVYLWDAEPALDRASREAFWWERADSQVPGGGGEVDFGRLLGVAREHAPHAYLDLVYHGTGAWELERIHQSVARGLRFVERRRARY
jgi:sugar phosphate isomerase/epimerase